MVSYFAAGSVDVALDELVDEPQEDAKSATDKTEKNLGFIMISPHAYKITLFLDLFNSI